MTTKYSLERVKEVVEHRGLGYAVESYFDYGNIEDTELAELWKIAENALMMIRTKLSEAD